MEESLGEKCKERVPSSLLIKIRQFKQNSINFHCEKLKLFCAIKRNLWKMNSNDLKSNNSVSFRNNFLSY